MLHVNDLFKKVHFMSSPVYAVGDIHGNLEKLERALSHIEADGGPDARIVFLGDYVDRGPDSRGVLDRLSSGLAEGRNWICLKGNHDRMFEWFLEKPRPLHDPYLLVGYHWGHDRIGGLETLASYGVTVADRTRLKDVARAARAAVPERHKLFLRSLPLSHSAAGLFFVHAGVRPGVPFKDQIDDDLLWIRNTFLKDETDHGAVVVHGHTVVTKPERYRNRINLDTGAGYGKALTVGVFENGEVWTLGPGGRVPLAVMR